MKEIDEDQACRLAAISVAAISNTRTSAAANRLPEDHPWVTAAYLDTVKAVEREMDLRDALELATGSRLTPAEQARLKAGPA